MSVPGPMFVAPKHPISSKILLAGAAIILTNLGDVAQLLASESDAWLPLAKIAVPEKWQSIANLVLAVLIIVFRAKGKAAPLATNAPVRFVDR